MAVVKELLRAENDGTLSFGNYDLDAKKKLGDFEFKGNVFKVKTFKGITKLECNETFVYESVPGTTVRNMKITDQEISFSVEGPEDAEITIGAGENTEYQVLLDDVNVGHMTTNMGGKLSFSVELSEGKPVNVNIVKV
ncbi:MAG: endosialidase [Bilifractor sp.]